MRRMIVATGQHRAHSQNGVARALRRPPTDNDQISSSDANDFSGHSNSGKVVGPGRPRVRGKAGAVSIPVGMHGPWIERGRQRQVALTDHHPLFKMVDERDPIDRRSSSSQQERMVPARIGSCHRPGSKPATAVGFEPFEAERSLKVLAVRRRDSRDLHQVTLASRWCCSQDGCISAETSSFP